MRLLHLSDLHITDGGLTIWDTDTKAHLEAAISRIIEIDNIDAIIITGDISNDGSMWSYNYVDEQLGKLGIPVYCCPGNHDIPAGLSNMKYCQTDVKAHIKGWELLFIDSSIPGMARGNLDDKTLHLIEKEASSTDAPIIIALHHPPVEPGGWLNRKLLENRDHFNDIIQQFPNIRLVLYGHTHCAATSKIGNIVYSCAPSLGFAFNNNLPKFQIANGEEGFNLIEINESAIEIFTILI